MRNEKSDELEQIEIQLLLEAIYRFYGFDFRNYAHASLKRRVWKRVIAENLTTISALSEKLLHDTACMERFLLDLSINVTSMFRDPSFYMSFRERVVPLLRTYPYVRIWDAGCSTGEEVYSMAILLQEEGLYDRCRIYATDMNEVVLARAKEGIFPLSTMQENTANYIKAGGTQTFSDYYIAKYEYAMFNASLREHVVFAQHNLATDASFHMFNVILCRNVMIYFNNTLQERVHNLFLESLENFGVLALGKKESIRFSTVEDHYEPLDESERLYRKVR